MIKLSVSVPVEDAENWKEYIYKKLKSRKVKQITLLKKSVDARDKGRLLYVYQAAVDIPDEEKYFGDGITKYVAPINELSDILAEKSYREARPVVVGSGPAGLFCALSLAILGAKPIVLERGSKVEDRKKAVENFAVTGILNENTNVQFGEGGAGTFSDGKLNTGISNQYISVVLNEFVKNGAPEEILYLSKPHIGTDKLMEVVKNMRKKIEKLGGEFFFNTTLKDIVIENNRVVGAVTDKGMIATDRIYLAIGHSSRDTFNMLYEKNVNMVSKEYSMGVRIEHNQAEINKAQYGKNYYRLPAADYKIAAHLDNGHNLYTFCMCPGGYVINASSERECLTVNGMSEFARNGKNANSAILVNVGQADWKSEHPLAGVEYQRKYEKAAYCISKSYRPPVQLFGDLEKNKVSTKLGRVIPSVNTGYVFGDLRACLPNFIVESVILGVKKMAAKLRGFDSFDSVLTGIEARSSSPVKILRDEHFCSSLVGLYPLGEGAGYAGGIMSAAVDGIKGVLCSI